MTETASSHDTTLMQGKEGGWKPFYEERLVPIKKYSLRNPSLIVGVGLMVALLLFVGIGHAVWDTDGYRVLSTVWDESKPEDGVWGTRLPPSTQWPFGGDTHGRDLMAVAIVGTPLTLRIGLISGTVAIFIGTIAAFTAAYYRGWVDTAVRSVVDVGLAMPALLILILVRINVGRELSVDEMGLAIGLVSWVFPARTIRSQVLVMREQAYVELSVLSGTSGMGVIFKEMMPNLIPYITASLVGSVAGAILASIGLEAIGLGNMSDPTLGMTIYWNIQFSSITLGMWWWWLPPLAAIVIVFVGLFLISSGLDEWSNPRLRKRV